MAGYMEQPHLHTAAPFRAAMLTYPGNLKEAFRQAQEDATKTMFGVAHGIPSTFLTKVIASTKPDFVWIDVEHGMYNRLTLHDAIHAVNHHSEGKSMVIVRVPKNDEVSLTTALDAGAAGIVIPHCESAEEVKEKMKEIFYPPLGQRSFSPWVFTPGVSDASLYPDDAFNMQTSNRHVAVIPQIESVKGIANAEEIAAVEGISGMMFGPGDYMADAGFPFRLGEPSPQLLEAMGKFAAAGKKHNVPLVGAAMSMDMVPMLIEHGYRMICIWFDVWGIAMAVHGNVAKGREYASNAGSVDQKVENGVKGGQNGSVPEGITTTADGNVAKGPEYALVVGSVNEKAENGVKSELNGHTPHA